MRCSDPAPPLAQHRTRGTSSALGDVSVSLLDAERKRRLGRHSSRIATCDPRLARSGEVTSRGEQGAFVLADPISSRANSCDS